MDHDIRGGRVFGGGELARKVSSSHQMPRNLDQYHTFFRQSSSREEGWLEIKLEKSSDSWESRWVVFDDGILYLSHQQYGSEEEDTAQIPMDSVISLRTDKKMLGETTIQIKTTDHKLFMRASTKEEMHRWLFCFQKSVALVLSRLLKTTSSSAPSTSAIAGGGFNENHRDSSLYYDGGGFNRSAGVGYSQIQGGGVGYSSQIQGGGGLGIMELGNRTSIGGGGNLGGAALSRQNASAVAAAAPMHISSSLLSASFLQQRQSQSQDIGRGGSSVAMPVPVPLPINRGGRSGSEGTTDKEKDKVWLKELGHGHGKHSFLQRHRSSLVTSSSSNSSTSSLEDNMQSRRSALERAGAERSVADLSTLDEQNAGYHISSRHIGGGGGGGLSSSFAGGGISASLGVSRTAAAGSAVQHSVPIEIDHARAGAAAAHRDHSRSLVHGSSSSNRSIGGGKIAGSYVDPDSNDALMRLSLSPTISVGSYASQSGGAGIVGAGDWDESQYSEAEGEEELLGASPGDGGDMMFEFEEGSTPSGRGGGGSGTGSVRSSPYVTVGKGKHAHGNTHGNSPSNARGGTAAAAGGGVSGGAGGGIAASAAVSGGGGLPPAGGRGGGGGGGSPSGGGAGRSRSRSSSSATGAAAGGLKWISGYCTKLGPRNANEDRFVSLPNFVDAMSAAAAATSSSSSSLAASSSSSGGGASATATAMRQGYFAVYDGHCGDQASTYLQDILHRAIYTHTSYYTDLEFAIRETCVKVDREFLQLCKEKRIYCGTTALGAFIHGHQLVVFNIGDCQAVLCSNGAAVDMNIPHKPGRPDEVQRIEAARGWITEEKELYMARLHRMDLSDPLVRNKAQEVNWVTINRVCGELAVSRSIGDPDYKSFIPGEKVDSPFLWPDGHDQIFLADPVIPVPDFKSVSLGPGDEFLIIASDGLWDVVDSSDAVSRVREALAAGKSASEAAELLCDLALKLGSSDNVTIVIVHFVHS